MESLNLDINTYSFDELRRVFKLPSLYTKHDVNEMEKTLDKQLVDSESISQPRKQDISSFLNKAGRTLRQFSPEDGEDSAIGTWAESYVPTTEVDSHTLIDNPNRSAGIASKISGGRAAGSADYPAGWLNPVNVRTISLGLNIDSRFREDYYKTLSSDYVIFLPETIKRVVQMRLSTIELPMSFYQISRSRGDATFVIMNNDSTVIGSTTVYDYRDPSNPQPFTMSGTVHRAWLVVLPDGNYELWQEQSHGAELIRSMNTAISTAIPGYVNDVGQFGGEASLSKLSTENDICFSVNRCDGRSSFALPADAAETSIFVNGFTVFFAVDAGGNRELDTNVQLHLGWQLGFRVGTYKTGSTADKTSAIISEGVCMVTGPRYAYISIDDGQKNTGTSLLSAFPDSIMDKHILSRFNIAAVMDDYSVFKPSSDAGLSNQLNRTREYFGPVDIQRLHIRIFDEYGRILDLNNMDWSMTLTFDNMYS
jgi:hypothetical protein